MHSALRILDTGLSPARWNVAMTAALAEMQARPGERAAAYATVRFHRYPPCVLIGAGQDLATAADVGLCRKAGIEIARRVTGGGAVYMSPGMLAWDVLLDRREYDGDLPAVTERVCGGIAAGLGCLGVDARFRAPNDIAVGGRKLSGSSGYAAGRGAILQGTVLIADDVPDMARALGIHEAELRTRVTCLAAELDGQSGAMPTLPAIIEHITAALALALSRMPVPGTPSREETALCTRLLREEIGTDAYVAGGAVAAGLR